MRERLRRFAVVGLVATTIDVGLAVLLLGAGWSPWSADVVALGLAAVAARLLHRSVTLRDDPYARWIRLKRVFVTVVVVAGLVDLATLTAGRTLLDGTDAGGSEDWRIDLAAKLVAVLVAGLVRAVAYRAFLFRVIRREQDHPSERPPPDGDVRVTVQQRSTGREDGEIDQPGHHDNRHEDALEADPAGVRVVAQRHRPVQQAGRHGGQTQSHDISRPRRPTSSQ